MEKVIILQKKYKSRPSVHYLLYILIHASHFLEKVHSSLVGSLLLITLYELLKFEMIGIDLEMLDTINLNIEVP